MISTTFVLGTIVTITLRVLFSSVLQYTYLLTPVFIQTYSFFLGNNLVLFFLLRAVYSLCLICL